MIGWIIGLIVVVVIVVGGILLYQFGTNFINQNTPEFPFPDPTDILPSSEMSRDVKEDEPTEEY